MDYNQTMKRINDLIKDIQTFYDSLAMHIFPNVPTVTPIIFNYETYIIGSMSKTIKLINYSVELGQINDSLSLCRNYYELVGLHLFLSCEINEEPITYRNEKIEKWINGYERVPDFWRNIEYLKKSNITKDIIQKIDNNEVLKKIKDELNDHMHFNSFHFILMNDDEISYPERTKYLSKLNWYLEEIFLTHFFLMFTINEHYMRSDDYTDSLDAGEIPDAGSLFWIAPFVQKVIDKHLKDEHSEIFNYFKEKSKMKIE